MNDLSLPTQFLERMSVMLGDEYDAFLDSYNAERSYGLRFNPLKINESVSDRVPEDLGI